MKKLTFCFSVLSLTLTACNNAGSSSPDGGTHVGRGNGALEEWQGSLVGQEGHGGDAIVCFSIPIERALYKETLGSENNCQPNIPCENNGSIGRPGNPNSGTVWRMTDEGRKSIRSAKPLEQYLAEGIANKKVILDQLNKMTVEEGYQKILAPFTKLPAAFSRISHTHIMLGWLTKNGFRSEYGLIDINDSGSFENENGFDKTHCKELQAVVRRDNQLWYDGSIVDHFDNAGLVLMQLHEEIYAWGKSQDQINWEIYHPPAHEDSTKTRFLIRNILDENLTTSLLNDNLKALGFTAMYWEKLFKIPTPVGYYMDTDSCISEQQFLKNFFQRTYGRDFWLKVETMTEERYLKSNRIESTVQLQHNFPDALSNMIALTMSGESSTYATDIMQLQAIFERPESCEGRF